MFKMKFQSFLSIWIIGGILLSCSILAVASATSTTYVVWNAKETEASAVTDGNAPTGYSYYVVADITSNSTDEHSFSYKNSPNGGSASTTAGPVAVTYPSPIPLVNYNGGHGSGSYPGY